MVALECGSACLINVRPSSKNQKRNSEVGEKAQMLRTLVALIEDPDSIPMPTGQITTIYKSTSGALMPSSWALGMQVIYRHTSR